MIVQKNRLALTYLAVFDFYIYDKYDFVFFVLQRWTISGPLWRCCMRFLITFKNDFYSIFYHSNFLQ